jgi:peptide/nickel transport system ATP-binding protein
MSDPPLLDVNGLTLTVGAGGPEIVKEASFADDAGEIAAIAGESGSGKTMAVRAVLDLLPPPLLRQSGEIRFRGNDLTALKPSAMRTVRGARIGMIFQEPTTSLNPALSIGRQLDEGLALHSV